MSATSTYLWHIIAPLSVRDGEGGSVRAESLGEAIGLALEDAGCWKDPQGEETLAVHLIDRTVGPGVRRVGDTEYLRVSSSTERTHAALDEALSRMRPTRPQNDRIQ